MSRLLFALLTLILAAGAAAGWHYRANWLPAAGAWDGQPNRYRIEIDPAAKLARIEASIWLDSHWLSMFDVLPIPSLPGGHVDLVEDLVVRDAAGGTLRPRDLGLGDFAVRRGQRLALSYRVRLEHDRHAWPMGAEEVAYSTDEGWLFRVSTLLFADGGERMPRPNEVEFVLPTGWVAHTPWEAGADPLRFVVPSRRELLSNVIFLGTAAAETIEAGGVQMQLVYGRRYREQLPLFRELLDTQMRSYQTLFGGNPLAQRYLIVINEGASGDGGAFASSFSQYIPGDATAANRVVWGHTMAHELLHFWNGLSLVPADHQEEWFKEGATDYLTMVTMARNGLIDETLLFKRFENVQRRVVLARLLQGLAIDVREAGRDKQPNRLLVYGGGSLAAFALDAELRQRSGDRVDLAALMASLYAEFAKPDARYTLADLIRHANALTGSDLSDVFAASVQSQGIHDMRPALAHFGLRMDSFAEEIYVARDATADAAAQARFAAAFAPPPTATVGLTP